MSDSLTIVLNTTNKAPSQYLNIPFTSVVEFGGELVWFGESGIYEEGGNTDNGTAISAWFDTPLHDFGKREQKELAAFDIGYETSGSLTLTITGDEDTTNARAFTLAPVRAGQLQQDNTKTLPKHKYGRKRYWGVRVANVGGCDFSVDYLALAPVILKRRARNAA